MEQLELFPSVEVREETDLSEPKETSPREYKFTLLKPEDIGLSLNPRKVRVKTLDELTEVLLLRPRKKLYVIFSLGDKKIKRRFAAWKDEKGYVHVFLASRGMRRYGWYIHSDGGLRNHATYGKEFDFAEVVLPPRLSSKEETALQTLRWRNYILKHTAPGLWRTLVENALKVTAEKLRKFIETSWEGKRIWEIKEELGLPTLRSFHRTTTLKSQGAPQEIIEMVREKIRKREEFSFFWRGKYDCSVSGMFTEDGDFWATLSLEYKDKGNGHYYLLLNENAAIWEEDD